MIPTLLLVGLILGLALGRRPRTLRLAVMVGATAWAIAAVVTADTGLNALDLLVAAILAIMNLGLGAQVGFYSVGRFSQARCRVESR